MKGEDEEESDGGFGVSADYRLRTDTRGAFDEHSRRLFRRGSGHYRPQVLLRAAVPALHRTRRDQYGHVGTGNDALSVQCDVLDCGGRLPLVHSQSKDQMEADCRCFVDGGGTLRLDLLWPHAVLKRR